MPTTLDRIAYTAQQTARVGWYFAQFVAGRRRIKPMPKPDFPVGPFPDRATLMREMRAVFTREWAEIEAGLYPAPPRLDADPLDLIDRGLAALRDLPNVDARRHAGINDEPFQDPAHEGLPRYYRQNFHYQSGGWLTEESAKLYDTQVEILFTGAADVMRRRVLKPVAAYLEGRDQREVRLLDIGCGTGRLLGFVSHAWPGMRLSGLDLSTAYLDYARRHIGASKRLKWIEGAGERLPFPDGSLDIVTSVFLFHELPKKVRTEVVGEMARVLKPGGRAIIIDSITEADRPEWKGLLDVFPYHFHEPYFADWVGSDPVALFAEHGLRWQETEVAFLSRVMTFAR